MKMQFNIKTQLPIASATASSSHGRGFILACVLAMALVVTPNGQSCDQDGCFGTGDTTFGDGAMSLSSSGIYNTALGNSALGSLTTGSYNTAVGAYALYANATA